MPPNGILPPLFMWFEHCGQESELEDAAQRETEKFIAAQPIPDSGAFAYINVTGEIFGSQL